MYLFYFHIHHTCFNDSMFALFKCISSKKTDTTIKLDFSNIFQTVEILMFICSKFKNLDFNEHSYWMKNISLRVFQPQKMASIVVILLNFHYFATIYSTNNKQIKLFIAWEFFFKSFWFCAMLIKYLNIYYRNHQNICSLINFKVNKPLVLVEDPQRHDRDA